MKTCPNSTNITTPVSPIILTKVTSGSSALLCTVFNPHTDNTFFIVFDNFLQNALSSDNYINGIYPIVLFSCLKLSVIKVAFLRDTSPSSIAEYTKPVCGFKHFQILYRS